MSADSSIMAAAIARNRRMVKSTKAREQRVHYIIIAIGWLLAVMVSSKHTAREKWRPTMNIHVAENWREKIAQLEEVEVEYNIAKLSDIEV